MEPWVIALVSAIASGGITVAGSAFYFGRNAVTKSDLTEATAEMTGELHSLRNEVESHSRSVGETISGLRQKVGDVEAGATRKINEVELYIRDTFVRRDSWHQAMNSMQERWAVGEQAAVERSGRIETKVDRLIDRWIDVKAL
jgi:hypothetical protein